MTPLPQAGPERLFTYEFTVLCLAATFGFCNIAVFYGLAGHLAAIGIAPAWRGTVIAAEPLAALLARPLLSVLLSPRRALLLARLALVGMGLVLPCYQVAGNVPTLLAVRLLHGVTFVCLVSAVTVLLANTVSPRQAGRAFGYFSFSSLVPYALMPPLVEWLLPLVGGEARAYAWTALLTLPALALLVPLGRPVEAATSMPDGGTVAKNGEGRHPSRSEVLETLRRVPVRLLLGANLLVFVGTTQVFFFIKSYAAFVGVAEPGIFFTVSTAASILVRLLVGPYFDRLPRRGAALLALLALGGCMACFAWAGHGPALFALAGVYGACLGVALPMLNASMFLESPARVRGMNMNLMLCMMDAGYVLGPLLGGALVATAGGYASLFATSAASAAAGALLLLPLALRETRERREHEGHEKQGQAGG